MRELIPRELPHSTEAEQGVLGSIMAGGMEVLDDARIKLVEASFYVPAHQLLFFTLCTMRDNLMPLDIITVTNTLRDQGYLEKIGGPAAVTSWFSMVPSAASVGYYIGIVREKYMLRELIRIATEAIRRAYEDQQEAQEVLEDSQAQIIDIGQLSNSANAMKHISEAIPEVMAKLDQIFHNRGKPIGLATGFVDLDRTMAGFEKGKKYYFGARPGMGKSSLATEFAEHVAIENATANVPVAIFSVEMSLLELTEVMLLRRAEVELIKLRDGFFSDEQRADLRAEAERMKRAPIYIDDTPSLNLFQFKARARHVVLRLGVQLIIIDYVQLMKAPSKQRNREQELTEITQQISATAKELRVPVIVLAQLNRKSEERSDKMPQLSDFRESGSLEQEADFVGLIHRPSYYYKTKTGLEEEAKERGMTPENFEQFTQLIIGKNRRGPMGKAIPLRFIGRYARFESEDPMRPLYSGKKEERQQKEGDE